MGTGLLKDTQPKCGTHLTFLNSADRQINATVIRYVGYRFQNLFCSFIAVIYFKYMYDNVFY